MKKLFVLLFLFPIVFTISAQTKTDEKISITPKQIIEKYVDAIGGRDAYLNIKDRTMFMTATMQGMTLKITMYQKAPNKLKNVVEVAGMEQTVVFDGSKAYMKAQDKVIEITGTELEKLSIEANMYIATQLDSLHINMTLVGIEKVNDKDAYKIEFSKSPENKWVEYYDKDSFLKVKEIKEMSTPQGNMTQEINYSDYKDFMGFQVPYKINQKIGAQEVNLILKSIEINTNLKDSIFE